MSLVSHCTIRVKENTWLTRSKLHSYAEVEGCKDPWGTLRSLLAKARKAALRHRGFVHKFLKLKLDSLPPRLEAGSVFTGQWVGLAAEEEGTLIVEPKYRGFADIYRLVMQRLPEAEPLRLAVAGLHIGGPAGIGSAAVAAWLLSRYLSATPPYIIEPLRLPGVPVPVSKLVKPNPRLYSTAFAAAALLSRTARRIGEEIQSLPGEANFLKALGEAYMMHHEAILATLRAKLQPLAERATLYRVGPDTEILYELLLAARTAAHAVGEGGRILLAPAPKIYEVFVLLSLHEALVHNGWRLEEQSLHLRRYVHSREALTARLYYNKPRPLDSRIIRRLSGSPPHPDMLLKIRTRGNVAAGLAAVLDAKYMKIGRRRALPLADALRLVGYAADLSANHELRAYIAAPTVETEERRHAASLDGLGISVKLLTVNHRVNQLLDAVKELTEDLAAAV